MCAQTQERLLLAPLLARLQSSVPGHVEVEPRLRSLLSEVRELAEDAQGYGPANLVALLRRCAGTCVGWTCRTWPCGAPICKGSRCRIPRLPERGFASAS